MAHSDAYTGGARGSLGQSGPLARMAPLIVLAAGVCWGSVGLFVRPLEQMGFSSFQLTWIRCALAALAFLVAVLVYDRELLRVSVRDAWCFLGTGLASVVFFTACYYVTISLTSLSVAAVLLYTAPAFVLVISHFLFGDAITAAKVLAVVLVVVGCAFATGMIVGVPQLPLLAVLTGLGSGVGYALYSVFSRFAIEKGYHSLTITVWTFAVAALGSAFIGNPAQAIGIVIAAPASIPYLLGLALINAVLPYALYTLALNYMENSRAAVIVSVEPVVATLLGVFVFGEAFGWFNAVGIALVMVAIALLARDERSLL